MKIFFNFFNIMGKNLFSFFKKHVNFILIILFFIVVSFAGYIFFQYGYIVAIIYDPKVTFKRMKVKSDKLDILIKDIHKKNIARQEIKKKIFFSPFIKLPEEK